MADPTAPPEQNPGQGDPTTQASPDFDYAHAYNELRPEYTRATQSLSEYEQLFAALQDPETQAEALAALGLELDTGSEAQPTQTDEFVDPLEQELEQLRTQVQELTSARELEAETAQSAEILDMRDDYIGEAIGLIEQQLGHQLSEREEEVLGNLAIAMETEQGVPDVQGAYESLYGGEGLLELNRQRWIDSKQDAITAPLGQPIPADRKPQNARERVALIDERARAMAMLRD